MTPNQIAEGHCKYERLIVDHIRRYRISTLPAILRLPGLEQFAKRQVRGVLNNLIARGTVCEASLFGPHKYFYLDDTIQAEGHRRQSAPLSEQVKVRLYATLAYCCLANCRRMLLTSSELEAHLCDTSAIERQRSYYVDNSAESQRLGLLRIDVGGHGRWDRIVAKCHDDMLRHFMNEAFQPWIKSGRFELAVVTPLPQKAQRLKQAILSWNDSRSSIIRIATHPELLQMIAPPPARRF